MRSRNIILSVVTLMLATILVLGACTPSASPTTAPTKATPGTSSTVAPKSEPTKPAAGATTTASKPTGAPIKVGFIAPFSGPMATYGFAVKIPAKMAEEDINASGGINGSPLQLVIEDSPFDAKQAVTVMRKLAEQDKVFAIAGPYATAEFEVAAPLANDLKVVSASNAMKPGIAAANRPWSFQMNVQDSVITPPAIEAFKKANPGVKSVVLVGDTKQSVTDYMMKDLFPKLLPQAGLKIASTVTYEGGTTDFSAIVTKIKNQNPEGIALAGMMPEAIGIAKELQRQQVKVPVVTSSHLIGGPVAELGGESMNGWIMPSYIDWESSDPKLQSFVKRFFELAQADPNITPKPQHLVIENLYYDTIVIFADIMRKAGIKADTPVQEARQKILDGMVNLKDHKAISGVYTMLPSGDVQRTPAPPFMAENGKYKILR